MQLLQTYLSECGGTLNIKDLVIALELDHTASATKPAPNQFSYVLPGVTGRRTQSGASSMAEWKRIVSEFRQWATRRGLSRLDCLTIEKVAVQAAAEVMGAETQVRACAPEGDLREANSSESDEDEDEEEDTGADEILFSAWDDDGAAGTEFDQQTDEWDTGELDWDALLTRFPKEFPLALTERALDFLDEASDYFFPILIRLAPVDVMSSPKGVSILKKVIDTISDDEHFPLLAGLLDTIPHGEIVGTLLVHVGCRLRLPVPHELVKDRATPLPVLPNTERFLLAVWWRLLAEVPVYWNYFNVEARDGLICLILQAYEEGLSGKNALCLIDPAASGMEQILRCSRITLAIRESSDAQSIVHRLAKTTLSAGLDTTPYSVCGSCIQMLLQRTLLC